MADHKGVVISCAVVEGVAHMGGTDIKSQCSLLTLPVVCGLFFSQYLPLLTSFYSGREDKLLVCRILVGSGSQKFVRRSKYIVVIKTYGSSLTTNNDHPYHVTQASVFKFHYGAPNEWGFKARM